MANPPPLPGTQPVPSTNASASTPPPIPSAPAVDLSVPPEPKNPVTTLPSPFVVTQKPSTPVSPPLPTAPAPVQPVLVAPAPPAVPDHDPSQPFILPPAPAPQVVSQPVPVAPVAVPTTPPPVKQAVPPIAVPAAPAPKPVMQTPPRPQKSGKGFLIALCGLLIAALLMAGGSYVLASNGSRIPVVYTYVSGLPTDGVGVKNMAVTFLNGQEYYQQSGDILLEEKAASDAPALPDGTTADSTTSSFISSIQTKILATDPVQYDLKTDSLVGKMAVTVDNATELPVYLNTRPILPTAQDDRWLINLPANTVDPLIDVNGLDIKKTLAYSALYPLPLSTILSAVQSEKNYQKVSGKNIVHYAYAMDKTILEAHLPEGAKISEVQGEVYYLWKTGEPVKSIVDATFTYQDRTYHLQENFEYAKWDETLSGDSDADLKAVLASDSAPSSTGIKDFIQQLGVDFSSMPNTVPEEALAPAFEPIVPTGETITTLAEAIIALPPLPETIASEQAKIRDLQRIADLTDLQKALEQYKTEKGTYPVVASFEQTRSSSILLASLVPNYLVKMPVDPLKDTFWYEYQSDGNSFIVRTIAEDTSNLAAKAGKAYYYFESTNK